MKNLPIVVLIALAPLVVSSPGSTRAQEAASRHDFARWEKEIAAYEAADRQEPPPRGAILFIGSSTVRRWKTLAEDLTGHKVINRAFGGSEIADSTHFADRIIFPYEPRQVFLRAGGNDIHAGKLPEEVAADFVDFVRAVHARLPNTEILFIGVGPAPARWGETDKYRDLNERIRKLALGMRRVGFVGDFDLGITPDGRPREGVFVADKVHFNADGYKLLADRVRPYLAMPRSKSPTKSTPTSGRCDGFPAYRATRLITSPPSLVPTARQVRCGMSPLTMRTESSRNSTLTPPGSLEPATDVVSKSSLLMPPHQYEHGRRFGGFRCESKPTRPGSGSVHRPPFRVSSRVGSFCRPLGSTSRDPYGGRVSKAPMSLCTAIPTCMRSLTHWARRASSRACCTAGKNRAIKTPCIAMTTRNSISVNPRCARRMERAFPVDGVEVQGERTCFANPCPARICNLVHGIQLVASSLQTRICELDAFALCRGRTGPNHRARRPTAWRCPS
jgi:lysophospholipase L1-like esterase